MSKIILVGANHGGTAAANTILDHYSENELVIFDRNDNISYLGCGTALWVGRQIDQVSGLFYCSKETLEQKNAKVYLNTEITAIDFDKKIVSARSHTGEEYSETYDKLILATGSLPIMPKIPGMELEQVHSVKLFQDGQRINEALNRSDINRVAVVGAGYIGVEIAEAIKRRGKKPLLFEAANTCLSNYYDKELSAVMDEVLSSGGVELHYGEMVKEIKGSPNVSSLVTEKGEYPVDMVIMAIGFRPNTILGKDHLQTFQNGAYQVNDQQQTSLTDVYAIGDCATVYSNALQQTAYIALATNAVRSGIVAGHNVCGTKLQSSGVQGSNGICIFDYKMVSTGLNMASAKRAGFQAVVTEFEDTQKPAFIKDENEKVKLRIIYDKETRRLLGAQMASYQDISMGIHMFSLAIEQGLTIDRLKLLDIFFLPHFNQPYNYITMAALLA